MSKQPVFTLVTFKRRDGDWGWRLLARNGKSVMVSGEGFKKRKRAQDYALKLLTNGVTVRLKAEEVAAV